MPRRAKRGRTAKRPAAAAAAPPVVTAPAPTPAPVQVPPALAAAVAGLGLADDEFIDKEGEVVVLCINQYYDSTTPRLQRRTARTIRCLGCNQFSDNSFNSDWNECERCGDHKASCGSFCYSCRINGCDNGRQVVCSRCMRSSPAAVAAEAAAAVAAAASDGGGDGGDGDDA